MNQETILKQMLRTVRELEIKIKEEEKLESIADVSLPKEIEFIKYGAAASLIQSDEPFRVITKKIPGEKAATKKEQSEPTVRFIELTILGENFSLEEELLKTFFEPSKAYLLQSDTVKELTPIEESTPIEELTNKEMFELVSETSDAPLTQDQFIQPDIEPEETSTVASEEDELKNIKESIQQLITPISSEQSIENVESQKDLQEEQIAQAEPFVIKDTVPVASEIITEELTVQTQEIQEVQEVIKQQEELKVETAQPEQPEISYPDDEPYTKKKTSFLCNIHHIKVEQDGSYPVELQLFVYPKSEVVTKTGYADIVVCAKLDGLYRIGESSSRVKAVDIEIQDYRFVVRGSFKDGLFTTTVNKMDTSFDFTETKEQIVPETRTSSFFKTVTYRDKKLDLFPVSFRNGEDGLVTSLGYVEEHGERTPLSPNFANVLTVISDQMIQIQTYWQGGLYHCQID